MDRVPIPVVIAVLLDRGRVFMVKRSKSKPLAGQWEFPGGKVEVGETPVAALRRELREELDLRVRRLALFGAYSHVYNLPGGPVHYVLIAYRANARPGPWDRAGAWVDADAAKRRAIVAGSRPIVADLLAAKLLRSAARETRGPVTVGEPRRAARS